MEITRDRLLQNGWESSITTRKIVTEHITLRYYRGNIYMRVDDGRHVELPAIRTMEQLALLFALLGDEPDTSALEARLRETLVELAVPEGLRAYPQQPQAVKQEALK